MCMYIWFEIVKLMWKIRKNVMYLHILLCIKNYTYPTKLIWYEKIVVIIQIPSNICSNHTVFATPNFSSKELIIDRFICVNFINFYTKNIANIIFYSNGLHRVHLCEKVCIKAILLCTKKLVMWKHLLNDVYIERS